MISSPELSRLLVCTILLVGGYSQSKQKNEELAQARAELEEARGEAAQDALPKPGQPSKITFVMHGYEGVNEAREFGPLKAEFEKRGYSCRIVRSPKTDTKTPHQDRAKAIVESLKNVEG